ncbi:hypothetical protein I6J77_07900 [Rhodanobacter sp. FDAARGOS 1247]|uniref:hypothetical protein n=1 Tax=Rhodanobacter sp. FDAARGOS 1247 TaxID=2778082 RepID=UPI00194E7A81|nr:hypothetical protein [Rhodanobacter sp. FDAARGOS 1247]QRP65329.1 hypothetical protein I6J77_07900 [Rhodanobacter sp. FDAARGOS 1247]
MLGLDLPPSLLALWESLVGFLNSTFISAFLSALAGAGFGAWGAQRITERSARAKDLLEALRQANAIVVLASTIANQALSLKKQHVKPLSDRYFSDREIAKVTNDNLLNGAPAQTVTLQAELRKMTPLTLPIEALKSLTFSAQLMPGRALALVSMIEQSAAELTRAVEARSEMIDNFHDANLPPHIFCQDYYGLERKDGNVNAMYHDTMIAVAQYTNDIAFFSAELAEELQAHGARVREKLLKLRSDVPKASTVDFSGPIASGLLPAREDYVSWLSGFGSRH